MKQRDVLETVAWAEKMFGSLVTNRECPKRDILKCVNAGLVKSIGDVYLCDDDCSIMEPERIREGFVLTDTGRAAIRALEGEGGDNPPPRKGEGEWELT